MGLALAQWAIEQGARHLVLVGSGAKTRRLTQLAVDSLKRDYNDVHVTILGLCLTDREAVAKALSALKPPVRGIFHLATAYTAQTADKVTPEQFKVHTSCELELYFGLLDFEFLFLSKIIIFFHKDLWHGSRSSNYSMIFQYFEFLTHIVLFDIFILF